MSLKYQISTVKYHKQNSFLLQVALAYVKITQQPIQNDESFLQVAGGLQSTQPTPNIITFSMKVSILWCHLVCESQHLDMLLCE